MNDKQFKVISTLLLAILILLGIIFFKEIITFFGLLIGSFVSVIAVLIIFISSLRSEDLILFGILVTISVIVFAVIKYQNERERQRLEKEAIDRNYLNVEVQNSIDDFFDETLTANINQHIEVFTKASELNSTDWRVAYCKYLLGFIYESHTYKLHDISKAISYYITASNEGSENASLALAKIFFNGTAIEKNYDLAKSYFNKAKSIFPSEVYLHLGLIARSENKYKKAFKLFEKSKNSDFSMPLASFKLGVLTYLGEGTEQNYTLAHQLMLESYKSCRDKELIYFAEMYFYGRGVDKKIEDALYLAITANEFGADCQKFIDEISQSATNDELAIAYYKVAYTFSDDDDLESEYLIKSHTLGCADATRKIAWLCKNGKNKNIPQDNERAFNLLKPLSDQSNPYSQASLAEFYFDGDVVEKNYSMGMDLLRSAASQNYEYAIAALAEKIEEEAKFITEESFDLYKKAADLGRADCCYIVGNAYLHGITIDKKYTTVDYIQVDEFKAVSYFEKGAELQNNDCQFMLAIVYYYGHNKIKQDHEKSLNLFKQSLSNGNKFSYKYLGFHYDNGLAVSINYKKAFYYYNKFLENFEDDLVYHNIGHSYLMGQGVDKDINKAVSYYEKSALHGLKASILALAYLYFEEIHIGKDLIKAATWFYVAASLGFNESFEELKKIQNQISTEGVEKAKANADNILEDIKKFNS